MNAIANNRHHVAVNGDVQFITQATRARDNDGPILNVIGWDREFKNFVEALDNPPNTSARIDVDHRKRRRQVDTTGTDNVRLPEEDDRTSICLTRFVEHLHCFAVEEHLFSLGEERVGGPGSNGTRAGFTTWATHPRQHILVCENHGSAHSGHQ